MMERVKNARSFKKAYENELEKFQEYNMFSVGGEMQNQARLENLFRLLATGCRFRL